MSYILVTALLYATIIAYMQVARRLRIFDCPNDRSSHHYLAIRGGGILFFVAGLVHSLEHLEIHGKIAFLTGLFIIAAVSFIDDTRGVPTLWRLLVHFIAVSFAFYGVGLFEVAPLWMVILAYLILGGVANAFNFMDGINGMTGLYSLVVLAVLQWINLRHVAFVVHPDFIWYAMIACVVFLTFNFRTRAKCFAGDVGSMSIAFWIIFLVLKLMMQTGSPVWLALLAVYGVDTIATILHRLYLRQNIFKAHRLHFFQVLTNEQQWSHLWVSLLYAGLQLGVSMAALSLWTIFPWWAVGFITVTPLAMLYCLKFWLMSPATGKQEAATEPVLSPGRPGAAPADCALQK